MLIYLSSKIECRICKLKNDVAIIANGVIDGIAKVEIISNFSSGIFLCGVFPCARKSGNTNNAGTILRSLGTCKESWA